MQHSALVIGYGDGIGAHLFEHLSNFHSKIAVSRSPLKQPKGIQHIQCDIDDFSKHLFEIKTKVSLVVYVASEFGESDKLESDEYERFMKTGPSGLLKTFNDLAGKGLLAEDALFVSIGSTASDAAYTPAKSHPLYRVAKAAQKSIIIQLTNAHKNYRFSNITLGGIGNNEEGVGYENISKTIEYTYFMSNGVRLTDVKLMSNLDI